MDQARPKSRFSTIGIPQQLPSIKPPAVLSNRVSLPLPSLSVPTSSLPVKRSFSQLTQSKPSPIGSSVFDDDDDDEDDGNHGARSQPIPSPHSSSTHVSPLVHVNTPMSHMTPKTPQGLYDIAEEVFDPEHVHSRPTAPDKPEGSDISIDTRDHNSTGNNTFDSDSDDEPTPSFLQSQSQSRTGSDVRSGPVVAPPRSIGVNLSLVRPLAVNRAGGPGMGGTAPRVNVNIVAPQQQQQPQIPTPSMLQATQETMYDHQHTPQNTQHTQYTGTHMGQHNSTTQLDTTTQGLMEHDQQATGYGSDHHHHIMHGTNALIPPHSTNPDLSSSYIATDTHNDSIYNSSNIEQYTDNTQLGDTPPEHDVGALLALGYQVVDEDGTKLNRKQRRERFKLLQQQQQQQQQQQGSAVPLTLTNPPPPPPPPLLSIPPPPPPTAATATAANKPHPDNDSDTWPENDFRLHVGNLSLDVSEKHLTDSFKHYKSLAKVKVVRDHSGRSRCFGFISFLDPVDMVNAIDTLDGHYCGTKPMVLKRFDKTSSTHFGASSGRGKGKGSGKRW